MLMKGLLSFFRTLTTPTEEVWPGVTSLPDYKPTFPTWKNNSLAQSVKQLDNTGLDLLQVHVYCMKYMSMQEMTKGDIFLASQFK